MLTSPPQAPQPHHFLLLTGITILGFLLLMLLQGAWQKRERVPVRMEESIPSPDVIAEPPSPVPEYPPPPPSEDPDLQTLKQYQHFMEQYLQSLPPSVADPVKEMMKRSLHDDTRESTNGG